MQRPSWSDRLWGAKAQFRYLLIATVIMLFTSLGGRELWTQEHRWADIVFAMLYRHDYLHPSLDGMEYYDKPLLSYWLIVAFATITGKLTVWTLRIPSALAGVLAVGSIYYLGAYLRDKRLGLMSGWLLLTTFYFVFWARTSSADMLNMAGTLFAVTWYFIKKDQPNFIHYSIFFLILALTALCKGLVGPVVAALAIFPDLLVQGNGKKHLRLSLVLGMVPAAIVYVFPFWASSYFSATDYNQNGLYLVYKENILRYFQPFDHKDPIYTYLIYLPIYILPWAFFFIPALCCLKSRWRSMSWNSKWMVWVVFILFLFFTFSGSRRGYYVLPIVPFALLMTADWLLSGEGSFAKRYIWAGRIAVIFFVVLFINFCVLQPFYYSKASLEYFSAQLRDTAAKIKPWSQWQIILLDPESKIRFYLQVPPENKNYDVIGQRNQQTYQTLMQAWPMLKKKPENAIFITRAIYVPFIRQEFKSYEMITLPKNHENTPVAFVPKK